MWTKRCFTTLSLAAAAACLSAGAQAQPANDACSAAATATVGANAGSAVGATSDGATNCEGGGGVDIYFTFTPPTTGAYSLSLCQDDVFWDTILSVHSGCPATAANTLACDDDGCGFFADLSAIDSVTLTAGTPYIIRIAGYDDVSDPDSIVLNITSVSSGACCDGPTCAVTSSASCEGAFQGADTVCTPTLCGAPAANDDCAGAIALTGVGINTTGSTLQATPTAGAAVSCAATTNDVWYAFTPSVTATFTANLCASAPVWDSVLSVHTACPGTAANQVATTACNDDGCTAGVGLSTITTPFSLTAGTTYYVRVGGYATSAFAPNRGDFTLVVATVAAPGACCAGAACTTTLELACTGTYRGDNTSCTPNPCAPLTGACCCGSHCSLTAQAACTGSNRSFAGNGSACTPVSNTVPCCRGDFNKTGAPPSVQDIFDFLSAYFSNDPCADTNDTGGAPSVQDIFDFLSAYFGGC
jgi:hypothetical protein